MESLG
jgi:hypothetical protein